MKVELKKIEDNCSNSCRKSLGDITNQLSKRKFVSISRGACLESGDGSSEIDINNKVGKKCSVVNEKQRIKRVCVSPRPCSEINSSKGNVVSGISQIHGENKEPNVLDCSKGDATQSSIPAGDDLRDAFAGGISEVGHESKDPVLLHLAEDDSAVKTVAQVGNALWANSVHGVLKLPTDGEDLNLLEVSSGVAVKDGVTLAADELGNHCVGGVSVLNSVSEKDYVDRGANCEVGQGMGVPENTQSGDDACLDEGDCHGGDDCVMSQTGSVDYARLPESQESRCIGLERCTTLKGDSCSNSSAAINMVKACTCSFCTKAAYIWADLHYQDLKGRIAAIKKSEKEASLLVERSCRSLGTEKHGLRNSLGLSNLESELMGQWRSLFAQMENIFEREGSHLEDSLLPLKDLREKCKADLELLNGSIL